MAGDQEPWARGYRSPVTSVSHLTSTQPKVSAVVFLIPFSHELLLKLVRLYLAIISSGLSVFCLLPNFSLLIDN